MFGFASSMRVPPRPRVPTTRYAKKRGASIHAQSAWIGAGGAPICAWIRAPGICACAFDIFVVHNKTGAAAARRDQLHLPRKRLGWDMFWPFAVYASASRKGDSPGKRGSPGAGDHRGAAPLDRRRGGRGGITEKGTGRRRAMLHSRGDPVGMGTCPLFGDTRRARPPGRGPRSRARAEAEAVRRSAGSCCSSDPAEIPTQVRRQKRSRRAGSSGGRDTGARNADRALGLFEVRTVRAEKA